jgi:glycosyltransferase involved in cell wall biosynthesis
MLAIGAAACGQHISLSFGHLDEPGLYTPEDFSELRELGVSVRPFRREFVRGELINDLYQTWLPEHAHSSSPEYVVFNDGISNFEDADFWVLVSDRLQACIPPHRPYAVVVYDYIQRYVPEIFGAPEASDPNWHLYEQYAEVTRRAAFVMCTTEQTRRDCITYVGVPGDQVVVFPMEFDLFEYDASLEKKPVTKDPYILWTTNSTEHKNHLRVIDGLEMYFAKHPDSPLKIIMSGVYTHLFSSQGKSDPHYELDWPRKVREKIRTSTEVKQRLKIIGNVSDAEYSSVLKQASWLLHGALYDNGTFSLIEAAALGVPSISSKYPAIVEECRNFKLQPALFDPYDPKSLEYALVEALPKHAEYRSRLPTRQHLTARNYKSLAPEYWTTFRRSMERLVA